MRRVRAHLLAVVTLVLPVAGVLAFSMSAPALAMSAPTASSVPVSSTARLLHAEVTRSTPQVSSYTVRRGDTLSKIAARAYGSARWWPQIWRQNKNVVKNPNAIRAGEKLRITTAWRHAPRMPRLRTPRRVVLTAATSSTAGSPAPAGPSVSGVGGSFEQCVISRESGGNPQIMNASGHWGLFQFSLGTWEAYGGPPGDFGNAGAGEQEQIFANAMATPGGAGNWAPYDGC